MDAARLIGVSYQRVNALVAAGHIPRQTADGRFKLGEFLRAYLAFLERDKRDACREAVEWALWRVTLTERCQRRLRWRILDRFRRW